MSFKRESTSIQIKWLAVCLAVMSITLSGCLKDREEFIPDIENVQTNAFGVVLDEQDLPVNMTTVVAGGETTETDDFGVFIFTNVVVPSDAARLVFSKDGYFETVRSFIPNEESTPSITVRLHSLGADYPHAASNILQLTTDEGLVIDASAGNWLQDGAPFDGDLTINTAHLSPDQEDLFLQLPGDIIAEKNDEEGLLKHFGSVYLQFRSDQSRSLSRRSDEPIIIQIPVPAELSTEAPAEIDLWKLDPILNTWIHQGSAELQGRYYVAEVTEEGVYSIQEFQEFRRIEGRIVDVSTRPVANALISIGEENSPIKQRMWTNNNGYFRSYIPIKKNLDLTIENECYEAIRTMNIGPFISSVDMEEIQIDPGNDYWNLSGQILKCDPMSTEGISSGYAFVRTDNHTWIIPIVSQGFFTIKAFVCSSSFSVSGKDYDSDLVAQNRNFTDLADKEREFSVGVLRACQ